MTEVKVTICIPHYMRRKLLLKCLKAIKKNVRIPYRILIINDSKEPLSFNDNNITVINNLERRGLGAARQQCLELVDTEYLFFLDDDVLVLPNSLELQIETLDNIPKLTVVSGLLFSRFKLGEAANFVFKDNKVIKKKFSIVEILSKSVNNLFYADFVPISHTSFRTETIKKLSFDSAYKIGFEHWDFFMQLYYAKLKCAIHTKSIFVNLFYRSPKEYIKKRFSASLLENSRKHFIEKWGYEPVTPKISRKEIYKNLVRGLFNKSVLAIYAKVILNYPLAVL